MKVAMKVIEALANQGLFRERDLKPWHISATWLLTAEMFNIVKKQCKGVWSHISYQPTRYELVQIRFPKAVFWGPSALWLHGVEAHEPETLWVAMDNKARLPTTLELSTVIIRTRHLEEQVVTLRPRGTYLELRAHALDRAQTDVARADFHRLLAKAADRLCFVVPREGRMLSAALPQREDWVTAQSPTRTPTPARSRWGSTPLPSPLPP